MSTNKSDTAMKWVKLAQGVATVVFLGAAALTSYLFSKDIMERTRLMKEERTLMSLRIERELEREIDERNEMENRENLSSQPPPFIVQCPCKEKFNLDSEKECKSNLEEDN